MAWHLDMLQLLQHPRQGGGEQEPEEVWWSGDRIRCRAQEGRHKWLDGKGGKLLRPAKPGAWTVEVEGQDGRATIDLPTAVLEVASLREPTAGDAVRARLAEDNGEEVAVRLVRQVGGGAEGKAVWLAHQGGQEEMVRVRLDGAQRLRAS